MNPSTVLLNALLFAAGFAVSLWIRGRTRLERSLAFIEGKPELDNVLWLPRSREVH